MDHGYSVRDLCPGSLTPTVLGIEGPFAGPWPTPQVPPVVASRCPEIYVVPPRLCMARPSRIDRGHWSVGQRHRRGTSVPVPSGTPERCPRTALRTGLRSRRAPQTPPNRASGCAARGGARRGARRMQPGSESHLCPRRSFARISAGSRTGALNASVGRQAADDGRLRAKLLARGAWDVREAWHRLDHLCGRDLGSRRRRGRHNRPDRTFGLATATWRRRGVL